MKLLLFKGCFVVKGIITRGITFGILILVVLNNPHYYAKGNFTQQSDTGWCNFQAISEVNVASPLPIMIYDNKSMTFIMWRSNNDVTSKSSVNYRIMFNNGTLTDTMTIAEFGYGHPYTYMAVNTHVANIDHLNRLNFLYYDSTIAKFSHVRYEDHTWVKISEVDIPYHAICLGKDADNNLRLIYKVREDNVDNIFERIFNGETWSEPQQITSHQKGTDTQLIHNYASDFATGNDGEIAVVFKYLEFYLNGSYIEFVNCLTYKNSWEIEVLAENYILPGPTCEFDDTGTLYVAYLSDSKASEMYYRTYQNSWSEETKLSISYPPGFDNIDLSICGSSIFLLNAASRLSGDVITGLTRIYTLENDFLEVVEFVYTSSETVPVENSVVLAIPNGNFYVITNEYDQELPTTYTVFFGFKSSFFTSCPETETSIKLSWQVFWAALVIIPVLVIRKKKKF